MAVPVSTGREDRQALLGMLVLARALTASLLENVSATGEVDRLTQLARGIAVAIRQAQSGMPRDGSEVVSGDGVRPLPRPDEPWLRAAEVERVLWAAEELAATLIERDGLRSTDCVELARRQAVSSRRQAGELRRRIM